MKRCPASLIIEITVTVSISQIVRNKELRSYTTLVMLGRNVHAPEPWVEGQGLFLFYKSDLTLDIPIHVHNAF